MLANTARLGGALYTGGSTTIAGSSFLGNSASENESSQGGAIYVSNHMTMTASSVTGNESTDDGGGIYVNSSGSGAVWISLSNISNNAANSDLQDGGSGGGIYHRLIQLTTPSIGYTSVCSPYWFVCYPTLVPVDTIIGDRSSNDFGINFGGGVTFGGNAKFYIESRYHYVWGPKVTNPVTSQQASTNAGYFPLTFGVRW